MSFFNIDYSQTGSPVANYMPWDTSATGGGWYYEPWQQWASYNDAGGATTAEELKNYLNPPAPESFDFGDSFANGFTKNFYKMSQDPKTRPFAPGVVTSPDGQSYVRWNVGQRPSDKDTGFLTGTLSNFVGPGLAAGVGALSGGFGLSDFLQGGSTGAGTDATWGVNPKGAGMDWNDFITNTFNPGDFTSSWLPGGDLSAYSGLGGVGGGMVDLGGAGAIPGAGLDTSFSLSNLAQQLSQKVGESAAKSVLGRVLGGGASATDWASLLGTLGATGLGIYGANKQSDALERIAGQARADRAPFLGLATGWANNPESYYAGAPAQAAMKGVLQGLSVGGNPANNPTAMASATEAGLRNWQNAVTGFGNLGLAGQENRSQLMADAATANRGITSSIASGLGSLTQPQTNTDDLLRLIMQQGI